MSGQNDYRSIGEHYASDGLAVAILTALHKAGNDLDSITAQDLTPVDQLHTRGKDATLELAHLAGITPEMRVLDVGGGLGGPARTLATEIGCSVEVLDVTEEFCRAGEMLTTRTGLGHLVSFRYASALDMPHPDASFDAVWMQHSSMNIADKERLYAEIHRVLRPGGHLALHEIMAGPVAPIHFPVPWARGPEISFLRPPEEVRALIHRHRLRGVSLDRRDNVHHTMVPGTTRGGRRSVRRAATPRPTPGARRRSGPDVPEPGA